jgi:hypothetical protein
MIKHIMLGAACIALAGCATSLSTGPDTLRTASNQALPGISYALPMLQYEVKVSYKLQRCPGDYDGNQNLSVKVETSATSAYVPGERYLIDYRALSSSLKTTDFTIETYADTGALKGINASAEDKTGDVIKSVTETAISGASILAGSPFAATQSKDPVQDKIDALVKASETPTFHVTCKPETLKAVQDREAALRRVEQITEILKRDGKLAEQIGTRASLKMSTATDPADLLKLHNRQIALSDELALTQAAIDKTEKKFAFEDHWTWPKAPALSAGANAQDFPASIAGAQPISPLVSTWARDLFDTEVGKAPDPKKLQVALAGLTEATDEEKQVKAGLARNIADLPPICATADLAACLSADIGVYASLETPQDRGSPCVAAAGAPRSQAYKTAYAGCPAVSARDSGVDPGVFVREPVKAQLILCGKSKPCYGTAQKPLHEGLMVNAPQLGQLRFIELSNGNFQNNALVVALNKDGTIEKLQYQEKAAIAAAALASISSSAGKVDAYLAKVRDQEEADDKAAEAKAKAAVADARAEVAYTRTEAAAVRTEAAAIRTDDVGKLQAQIDVLTKQKSVNDLVNPPDPVVAKEFADENIRLKAELERVSTQLAIREAVAKLEK